VCRSDGNDHNRAVHPGVIVVGLVRFSDRDAGALLRVRAGRVVELINIKGSPCGWVRTTSRTSKVREPASVGGVVHTGLGFRWFVPC